jgi:SecD-like export protein
MRTDTLGFDRFGLDRRFFPLQISRPTFPFFNFIILLAHKYLYIANPLSLFGENMMIRPSRFNIYLLLALCLTFAGGCQTAESRRKKELCTLRLHLEVNSDGTDRNEPVPIYRAKPILVNVEKKYFLDEGHVVKAAVNDDLGSFVIQIQFDREGTWLLEQYSAVNRGRRVAIFSQFGQARWLAAPVITHRIADGLFTFTPDATREEAERIVLGLNNVARGMQKRSK